MPPDRVALLLAPLLLAWTFPAQGQEVPRVAPEEAGLSAEGLERVTSLLQQSVDDGVIAGAVAGVARRGALGYLEAVGVQDLASRTPMTDQSLFRIYSMTKAVTAVAVMTLYEEGRFDLDDPVSRYLPAFDRVRVRDGETGGTRPPARAVTIRDLLLHTSGMSHRTSPLYRNAGVRSRSFALDRFVDNVVATPLMEDPGTRWRYSESPTVLGALVEAWSGQPFDAFLQERIFEPLGMIDTGFWVEPERQGRLTTVYRESEDGGLEPVQIEDPPFTERPTLLEGTVGLVSTVPDYLRFGQMLLNGGELGGARLLDEETVAMMTANGLSEDVLETRRGVGWGLANVEVILDAPREGDLRTVGEYGWTGSAGTLFRVNPAQDLVLVLMWQMSSPADPDRLRERVEALVYDALLDGR
jgi:CubicO group peptidase (beta-lactamase class C family)